MILICGSSHFLFLFFRQTERFDQILRIRGVEEHEEQLVHYVHGALYGKLEVRVLHAEREARRSTLVRIAYHDPRWIEAAMLGALGLTRGRPETRARRSRSAIPPAG
jgi:hypothetical protein